MRDKMRFQPGRTVLSLGVLLAAWAAGAAAFAAQGDVRPSDLMIEYRADREMIERFFKLPASQLRLDRTQAVVDAWGERLQGIDFERLDPEGKIDFLILQTDLRRCSAVVARERQQLVEIAALLPFQKAVEALELARWRAEPFESRAAATKLVELGGLVKKIRQRVQQGNKQKADGKAEQAATDPEGPIVVEPARALRAAEAIRGIHETLKGWHGFYAGYRPDFDWWVKKPYEEVLGQLDSLAKVLREETAQMHGKDDDPILGEPIGAEAVAAGIRAEWIAYRAEELIAIGERELAWCEQQMKVAAGEMGLGDDWKAALQKVKADFAPPGGQDELTAQISRDAAEFVRGRKLIAIPPQCEETWRLTMISPEGMKTIPYAAYGGQEIMVAYAKDEMSQDDNLSVMRGNNRHFMRLVVPHELLPGHHLQAYFATRYNTARQEFFTPFYTEGWALYWELRLWDEGWAKTPEDRIGMLFWRMTRAARVVVSLKYHLGQMKPPEMIDFLMERVGHERLGATSEVRRFVHASPLYQAAYLIGGKQLKALHDEMVGGQKMSEEAFHEAVLKSNATPIELLRARLENLPMTRDMEPGWKFAD